jgi:hypothetical protein
LGYYFQKEAQSEIEALTGIRRSETQVREFLKKLHLRCRKIGMIPAKAGPKGAYVSAPPKKSITCRHDR